MRGEFFQNDEDIISNLQEIIEDWGGSSSWRYILDLSMATDLVVAGSLENPICRQLTTNNEGWLEQKKHDWKKRLQYWKIERGLLISYSPKNLNKDNLATVILEDSDNLSKVCYYVRSFG